MLGDADVDARDRPACWRRSPRAAALFVLVSNEVGLGIVPDHPLGRAFRDAAGRMNQRVAAAMREVYFVAAGMVLPLQPFPGRES